MKKTEGRKSRDRVPLTCESGAQMGWFNEKNLMTRSLETKKASFSAQTESIILIFKKDLPFSCCKVILNF
jgi:hypothetical protein